MWKPGDRVLASRPGEAYLYPGVVHTRQEDLAHVLFDDGAEADVPAGALLHLQIELGDCVQVRMPAGRTYAPARVVRRLGEKLTVEYSDGEQESTSLGMVRIDPAGRRGAPPRVPRHAWIVGDRVLGKWSWDFYWYPGTVQAVEGEQLYVAFDDGDREWMPAARVMPLDFAVGSRVYGRWQGGPHYYPGRVARKDGETLHIHYDDGDQETTTVSVVRVLRGGVGQRVLAQGINEPFFYPGVVRAVEGELIEVRFDDGERAKVAPWQALVVELEAGDRVQARWRGGPNYYPGVIAGRDGDQILVQYEDGQQEWTTVRVVRVLPQELHQRRQG